MKSARDAPRLVDVGEDLAELLVLLAASARVIDHRVGDGARQHGYAGVSEENLRAADGEGVAAGGFVEDEGGDEGHGENDERA